MSIDRRRLLAAAGSLTAAATVGRLPSASAQVTAPSRQRVIDVHTHMYTPRWVEALEASGDPDTIVLPAASPGGDESIQYRGVVYARLYAAMFDWDARIAAMDEAGVDMALVSLTAPNVYWGAGEQSAEAARIVNEDFAEAQARRPDRIRWFASLPWDHADLAVPEVERAKAAGAVGICTLTNIKGRALIDDRYKPVWEAIEAAGMPVFIHPTTPYVDGFGLERYGMANTIGFTTDTATCFGKMLLSGFFERFPAIKPIACHGGGTLPYLMQRFDRMWEISASRDSEVPPSAHLRRIYFDAILYDRPTLEFLIEVVGADRVLYGSDYPFRLGDMAGIRALVDALPAEQRDAVRGGNAQALFGL